MKVGDMVTCKKTMFSENDPQRDLELFSEGCTYKIKEFNVITAVVYFAVRGWTTFLINGISSSVRISHPDSYGWNYFYDYFYTVKESRKLKLDKINNV